MRSGEGSCPFNQDKDWRQNKDLRQNKNSYAFWSGPMPVPLPAFVSPYAWYSSSKTYPIQVVIKQGLGSPIVVTLIVTVTLTLLVAVIVTVTVKALVTDIVGRGVAVLLQIL